MSRRRQPVDKALQGKLSRESIANAMYVFGYIKPYKWYFIGGMVLLFLGSLMFMLFPLLAGELIDIAQGQATTELGLKEGAIILVVLFVLQGLFSYLRVIAFAQVSERGLAGLRKDLFDKLLTLPIHFFEGNKSGEVISRVTGDVEKLYSAFSVALAEFLRQIIILITGITLLMVTTPRLAWIMLLTFPVIVIGAMFFGRFIRKLSKERQDVLAESNNVISDSLQAMTIIKAFTNEWKESLRFSDKMSDVVSVSLRFAHGKAIFSAFIVTVLFGGVFLIIWQGALMIQNGDMTAGGLVSFVAYTAIIGGAIAGLGTFYTELLGALGATERVREILHDDSELDIARVKPLREKYGNADLELSNLSFSYPSRPDITVLKDISLSIKSGETVALVGPSGAGKSTIVQLLLRLYSKYEGEIKINNTEISNIDMLEYRSLFAFVPQEVILFSGTIAENIHYGRLDATDNEIVQAAEQAYAMEFIERFPEGLQTIIGERGVRLSGGQRQRLAIARALLNDPLLLILDEATSNLDSESEGFVQDALRNLMKGRTSIVIAHRLSTIQNADRIFVLNEGEIIENGTHTDLLKNSGLYSHLIALQQTKHTTQQAH
mgnify:CR=1 FL=1